MRIIRDRDKDDRIWRKFKSDGMNDAVRRAEYEAKQYLDSAEGRLWIENTAYHQAEEILLDQGIVYCYLYCDLFIILSLKYVH